jgi:hypothetical protein
VSSFFNLFEPRSGSHNGASKNISKGILHNLNVLNGEKKVNYLFQCFSRGIYFCMDSFFSHHPLVPFVHSLCWLLAQRRVCSSIATMRPPTRRCQETRRSTHPPGRALDHEHLPRWRPPHSGPLARHPLPCLRLSSACTQIWLPSPAGLPFPSLGHLPRCSPLLCTRLCGQIQPSSPPAPLLRLSSLLLGPSLTKQIRNNKKEQIDRRVHMSLHMLNKVETLT